tara:strand:- start:338 stop:742 length:405 start_codon:yes stop_codon:yes gene_type:complete
MKLENIKSNLLPPFDNVGIGHAVRYGEWLFISGQIPIDKDGNIVGKNDVKLQTIQVYEIIQGMLNELGFSLDNIIKLTTFYVNSDDFPIIAEVRKSYFNKGHLAASSAFCVSALAHTEALVEVEAIAILTKERE